jgi:transcriptional regulator with XRE-family HTH domain
MNTSIPSEDFPLRRLRLRARLSQVGLAARARCSLNTVSLAERGGFLSREMAARFAQVLGCDVADLLPERKS